MARPKKSAPNHSSGMYRFVATVGHKFDGTPIRKSFYSSKSKADARLKAEEYKIQQAVQSATGEISQLLSSGFDKCSELWLKAIKPTVADRTYEVYETSVRLHLSPYFGKAKMCDISLAHVQDFLNQYATKVTKETLTKYKHTLNKIFKFAISNKWCVTNPVPDSVMPKTKEPIKKRTWTQKEVDIVMEFCKTYTNDNDGLKVAVMLEYGLRIGELFGLRRFDLDHSKAILKIRKSAADVTDKDTGKHVLKLKDVKNQQSKRDLPISREFADKLHALPGNSEMMFPNSKGGLMSPKNWASRNYQWFLHDLVEFAKSKHKIDLPQLTPHELRHTRASLWVNGGYNLFAIAKMLGHTDLKMLEKRYAHANTESTRELMGIK